MKKSLFILYFLARSFFGINYASADSTAVSNSGALSNSTAIGAIGNNGASSTVEQQFNNKGSDIPVTLPGIPGVAIPTPQNFSYGPLSNPTNINGITASLYLKDKCKPVYTRNGRSMVDVRSGASRNTKIVFTSYPDYKGNRYTTGGPEKVLPYFPASSGNYICIGTMMITANKGSEAEVDINVVGSDTENYIFDNMEGYSEIYSICPTQAIGTAVGSSAAGNGFSLGGAAAGLVAGNPGAGLVLGLAAALSKTEASTHPDGRNGNTCWVLGKPKNPGVGVPFSEGEFEAFLQAQAIEHAKRTAILQSAGGNGSKYEATK